MLNHWFTMRRTKPLLLLPFPCISHIIFLWLKYCTIGIPHLNWVCIPLGLERLAKQRGGNEKVKAGLSLTESKLLDSDAVKTTESFFITHAYFWLQLHSWMCHFKHISSVTGFKLNMKIFLGCFALSDQWQKSFLEFTWEGPFGRDDTLQLGWAACRTGFEMGCDSSSATSIGPWLVSASPRISAEIEKERGKKDLSSVLTWP